MVGPGDVHGGLDDVVGPRSGGGQGGDQVRHDLLGLRDGVVGADELTIRAQRDRAGREHERGTPGDRHVGVARRCGQLRHVAAFDAHLFHGSKTVPNEGPPGQGSFDP